MPDPAHAPEIPSALIRAAYNPRSSGDQVAAYIRSLIFHGHLRQGDRIRQDELAATLGVSRIPVREAIIALDREGWVTSEPHRGAFVNGLDPDGISDHYEMLGMLLGLAARRAAERGTPEQVERLVAQQKALQAAKDPDEFYYENEQILRQIFTMADSSRLSAVSRVMTAVVPGNFFAVIPGAIPDQKKAMARIVKTIAAHDGQKAAQEWLQLLRRHGEHVIELMTARNLFRTPRTKPTEGRAS
jgi:DNA-binding GntR family transcriptional regulator